VTLGSHTLSLGIQPPTARRGNIELQPGSGEKMCRAAGEGAIVLSHDT